MSEDYIQAKSVQVLTLATKEKEYDSQTLPFLRFLLENGSEFVMSMIPKEIAIAISMHISGTEVNDSRLRTHDLIGELALVEKVEIDSVVPGTGVYQATISLVPEGFNNTVSFQMIPSNATLIAVLNDAPIFVSTRLWKEYIESRDAFQIQIQDENIDDIDHDDDFDDQESDYTLEDLR
jgi:bifunctional DNase/RNase